MNRARILWTAAALAATSSGWLYHFATTPPPDLSRHSVSTTPDPYAGIASPAALDPRGDPAQRNEWQPIPDPTQTAALALERERLRLEWAKLDQARDIADDQIRAAREIADERNDLDYYLAEQATHPQEPPPLTAAQRDRLLRALYARNLEASRRETQGR